MINLGDAPEQKEFQSQAFSLDSDIQSFREWVSGLGLYPPETIDYSGNIARCDADKPGDKAGFYALHPGDNISYGMAGSWKQDNLFSKWCSRDSNTLTEEQRLEYRRIVKAAKAERERLKAELQETTRVKAQSIWSKAQETIAHPYLQKKLVSNHGLKQSRGALVVPASDAEGTIHSLQFIQPDGSKKFLFGGRIEGCSFTIPGNDQLIICEGYSTGASIHKATGATVISAFNAGNLEAVAKEVRRKCPDHTITICGDDDQFTDGNPGRTKATAAAKLYNAKLCFPVFKDLTSKPTDFNDLFCLEGIEAVRSVFKNAVADGGYLAKGLFEVEDFRKLKVPAKKYHLFPAVWTGAYLLIVGARGVGKTFYVWGMINAITTGQDFGPWSCHEPGSVMLIDGELSMSDLQERAKLEKPATKRLKPLYLLSDAYVCEILQQPSLNLGNAEVRALLRELILSKGVNIAVFDNIASLTPGIDENSKLEWDEINQWFIGLRYAGVSCWLVHHLGKTGDQRGTSGREDNIDISIKLSKPNDYQAEDGARFIVSFPKKRVAHKHLHLVSDIEMQYKPDESGKHEWITGESKQDKKLLVLNLLAADVKQSAVATQADISQSQVSKIKAVLIKEGLLDGYGLLTMTGKSELLKAGYGE